MNNFHVKQRLVTIAGFLAVMAVVGVVVTVSGVVPIKASSGHWMVTKWFLHFSKTRSIKTHSMGIKVPPLDDPALVLKGAGHFEFGCVQCHGAPGRPASPIALAMTAEPPYLPTTILAREPEELFYIVKHGIKFTGMPAWPDLHRDDEVWAMVAFLLTLPDLGADEYRGFVADPAVPPSNAITDEVPHATMESCHGCHGRSGLGRGEGVFPKLAGQTPEYLYESLKAYSSGQRSSGTMHAVAGVLNQNVMHALADHYAQLATEEPAGQGDESPTPAAKPTDEELAEIERGRQIAENGIPDRKVPSCVDCHGPKDGPRSDRYPRLAGQYADYLVLQLQLFKSHERGGTSSAHLMRPVADHLTEEAMRSVAKYYASLTFE